MSILRYLGLSLVLVAMAACGSTGTTTPEGDASVEEDASVTPDPTKPPSPPKCERLTCADLIKDGRVPCGVAAGSDGCGGTLACAEPGESNYGCPEGFFCKAEDDGVARCQELTAEDCTPLEESVACEAVECGVAQTGCFGKTYNCGTCGPDSFCQGGTCHPNKCTTQRDCSNAGPGGTAVSCGEWGDGCGGILNCSNETGGCGAGEVCQPATGQCIEEAPPACLKSPADACAGTCGIVSDGCDGTYDCAAEGHGCPSGTVCGVANPGATPTCGTWDACTPDENALRAACDGKCGYISNGCDGVFNCSAPGNGGVTCSAPNTCGGGGTHNECGAPASSCTDEPEAITCAGKCGPVNNNCGNLVECGGCPAGEACGNGGAFTCGPEACQPLDAATVCSGKCGYVSNGCDGEYNCAEHGGIATCPVGEICGYGGVENTCGGASCTAESCADRGATCGEIITCGEVVNCWPAGSNGTCPNPATEACKELTPGVPVCTDQGGSGGCAGSPEVCSAVPVCPSGSPTRITGYVTTPDGELRVPNAIIYIQDPAEPLPVMPEGVDYNDATASCERCDDQNHGLGRVLASATTDFKGEYSMTGAIPTGVPVRVVVKTGRWRGVYTHTFANDCVNTNVGGVFKLPGSHNPATGDHLPKIAVATGQVDAMECVLYKMGIELDEFTTRAARLKTPAERRIHLFRANGGNMRERPRCWHNNRSQCRSSSAQVSQQACASAHSQCTWNPNGHTNQWIDVNVDADVLTDSSTANGDLFDYDMTVWDCEAGIRTRGEQPQARVLRYVDHGGRFFASHWSYDWISGNGSLANVAEFSSGAQGDANANSNLSFGRARANPVKLPAFARWLNYHGAGNITFDGNDNPIAGTIYTIDLRSNIRDLSANTDEWIWWNYGGRNGEAGHPSPQQFSFNTPYGTSEANACGRVAFTAFHVATTGSTSLNTSAQYFPSYCAGSTLTDQEKTLAYMIFDLANCVSAGEPPRPPECEPKTTADCAPNQCGVHSDGCGGTINCGGCADGGYCSPVSGLCEASCTERNPCNENGFVCGTFSDGCSGTVNCGTCPQGEICSLLEEGQCGSCQPLSCDGGNVECGVVADGCGGYTADCGSCPSGQVCGGGGTPNECGSGSCNPAVCGPHDCGVIPDGCGGIVNCSECPEGEACGIVEANICSPICEPIDEADACAGLECGWVGDGCGGAYDCGDCTNGGDCGGAGPNMCGEPCAPTSCAAEGANCGYIADGCGTLLNCGSCTDGEVCGATSPNQCGTGVCEPITECSTLNAECGSVSDGCDGQLECGDCPAGHYCSNDNVCVPGEGGCEPATCADLGATCGGPPDGCGGRLECGECGPNEVCGLFVQYSCGSTG